ncbi:MAG: SBBP repeat-containing protein [Bacteroidetes bacterium]|nr:SBBP repeat-containing protein [Bacteroidota bacterium]
MKNFFKTKFFYLLLLPFYSLFARNEEQAFQFIENKGQVADFSGKVNSEIKFTAKDKNTKLFFGSDGIQYQFEKSIESVQNTIGPNQLAASITAASNAKREITRLDMKLIGANSKAIIKKEGKTNYYENYYLAHCPQGITEIHAYTKITYEEIYPGIDWVIYSKDNQLEYDFIVHPGANPACIKMQYLFAKEVKLELNGSANISTKLGEVLEAAPVCFISETDKKVQSHFTLKNNCLAFNIENYDKSQTLIIDPVLLWSSYYGGSSIDKIYSCNVDTSGNVVVAGITESSTGIASVGGFQTIKGGLNDGFISKFDAAGNRLWATYFGAADDDFILSTACDKAGNIFAGGITNSIAGISSNGFQANFGGGAYDGFVAKFNPNGTRNWSTFYGGPDDDAVYGCAVDATGNFYFTGTSLSNTGIASSGVGINSINAGGYTTFLAKFTTSGTRTWATYFGDGGDEYGTSCSIDKLGNIYVAGYCFGSMFMGIGGFQGSSGGSFDAILVKFNSTGQVLWATYYGNFDSEVGLACTTDNANNIYLAGRTSSSSSIASGGAQNTYGGGLSDGFLVKFDENGGRIWATYAGNSGEDLLQGVATDRYNNVVVCGTTSGNTGIALNAFQSIYGGGTQDGFVISYGANGTKIFGSFLGGSSEEYANACTIDKSSNIYIGGETTSSNFLVAGNIHQTSIGGTNDGFLTKIENPCLSTNASFSYTGTPYACATNNLVLNATTGLGYNYQWLFNGAPISNATTASFAASNGGYYAVVVNQNGLCQDTSAALFVDSLPPQVPICLVTVDSLSKFNQLIWEKPVSSIIDSFRIYREDITNLYSYIKSISYNAYSVFVDSNLLYANPNVTSKFYKISTVDICGNEGLKSAFHHSIKLNDQANGNFDWNFYEVEGQTTPVLQYLLLRDSASLGIWTTIAITSGNVNQVSDPDYGLYPNSRYRVITNMGGLNCNPTQRTAAGIVNTRSNIKNKNISSAILANDYDAASIQLSPNPSSKSITLINSKSIPVQAIKIIDCSGRLIRYYPISNENKRSLTFDISDLEPAIYQVIIEAGEFSSIKKLMKF